MYDELVKRLRDWPRICAQYDGSVDQLHDEAADAIEELNSQLDDFKRLCLPLKDGRLYKYSDGSFVEVFLILPSEPPKEE